MRPYPIQISKQAWSQFSMKTMAGTLGHATDTLGTLHQSVVVNGLWNANNADRQLSLARCLVQQIARKLGAIATHQEQQVDASWLKCHNLAKNPKKRLHIQKRRKFPLSQRINVEDIHLPIHLRVLGYKTRNTPLPDLSCDKSPTNGNFQLSHLHSLSRWKKK